VLPDLACPHLLDNRAFLVRRYRRWIFACVSVNAASRTAAPDHVVVSCEASAPKLELEMTLAVLAQSFHLPTSWPRTVPAHIESLCKWGPDDVHYHHRTQRARPSGRSARTDPSRWCQDDPTWALEYDHFKHIVAAREPTDLSNDRWLLRVLGALFRRQQQATR